MDVGRWDLYRCIRDIQDRKIIIFGTDERAERLCHKLSLLDLEVSYFVDDIVEETTLCGHEVRNYHDLLYEDSENIKVIIMESEDLDRLFKIGVCTKEKRDNCLLLFGYSPLNRLYPVDPTVGYNIRGDVEYPGFILFGDREAKYTVVTLGGSTTDALYMAYATNKRIKSWSEILSEKLKEAGISTKVLCGGVAGYKSSQELLKLIRDVIPLQPNMVITYDGFNELSDIWVYHSKGNYPFLNYHQKQLFSLIAKTKRTGVLAREYTFGIDSKWNPYINWKNSVKMMHLVCEGYGIKYLSVLQPSFYNQVEKISGKSDREILMHIGLSDEYKNAIENFFGEKDKDEWNPEWLKDLRDIFLGIDNIFYDTCHVNEIGNEIIADRMIDYIKEGLSLITGDTK